MKKPKLHKQEKSYSCIEKNTVYVLDPEDGEKYLNKDLFEQLWQKNDYNGIIIKKPGDLIWH